MRYCCSQKELECRNSSVSGETITSSACSPQTWHNCHSIKTPAYIFVHSTPINMSRTRTLPITCLVAAPDHSLPPSPVSPVAYPDATSPRSSAPTEWCPRSKPQHRWGKVQDYSPKLNYWIAACASLQERTLIAVFRLQGLALLHVCWSEPGTSCRTVQTCWDAWRGVLNAPFFSPTQIHFACCPSLLMPA